ncbi:ABC transporter substrate-binding protein [Streptomyces sp. NPDC059096]|uniref:ABC transporter substrate-binding protein n=1 Tax=unclassified Streptomyces TaxID=2593676 RepID=UPI0036B33CDD
MRRLAVTTAATLLLLPLAGCAGSTAGEQNPKKLTVSTFGFGADLFEKNIVKPFEKETGIEVEVESGANAERLTKLRINRSDPTVDVVMISDLFARMGREQGLFDKVDAAALPNLARIHDFAKDPDGYAPAYTYQLLGMLYRTDKVDKAPGIEDLWDSGNKGRIALPDISTSAGVPFLYSTAAAYGSGPGDTDTAFEKLAANSPNVLKYFNRSTELVSLLDRGEVEMAPALDLFAIDSVTAGKPIAWAPLDKGRYVVSNTAQLVKGAHNKAGAQKFIDYLLSKEVQEKAAATFHDKPVNKDATIPAAITEVVGEAAADPAADGFTTPDLKLAAENNDTWVDRFQREVSG